MNEKDLNRVLQQAATTPTAGDVATSLKGEIMARVRVDDGRARRWRSWVRGLLIVAAVVGVGAAAVIGWTRAARDTTHERPPVMSLFQEGRP